jgi:hypothetical protein
MTLHGANPYTGKATMPIQLWHFTVPEYAESIIVDGFRDGRLGFVFFAPAGDRYWELGGTVLVELTLDVDEQMIAINKSESPFPNGYCQSREPLPITKEWVELGVALPDRGSTQVGLAA